MLDTASKRILAVIVGLSLLLSTFLISNLQARTIVVETVQRLQPYANAPWRVVQPQSWPLPCNGQPYRVLALGDSITAGWYPARDENDDHPKTPYALQLHAVVPHALEVTVAGEVGAQSHLILENLFRELNEHEHDIIIVMSGTNDVLAPAHDEAFDPFPALRLMKRTWSTALAHSNTTFLVVLNLMDIAFAPYDERVNTLNALIPDAVASLNSNRVSLMDLHAQFTMLGRPSEETDKYWADPVHPSAEGYAHMGRLIGEHLKTIIPC